jgi:hypothetical protein
MAIELIKEKKGSLLKLTVKCLLMKLWMMGSEEMWNPSLSMIIEQLDSGSWGRTWWHEFEGHMIFV